MRLRNSVGDSAVAMLTKVPSQKQRNGGAFSMYNCWQHVDRRERARELDELVVMADSLWNSCSQPSICVKGVRMLREHRTLLGLSEAVEGCTPCGDDAKGTGEGEMLLGILAGGYSELVSLMPLSCCVV